MAGFAKRATLVVSLAVAPLASFGVAEAAPHGATSGDSPERRRALELFEESAKAYREGRFQDAVDKLLEARRLKNEPVLLYNLARAYEALGKPQEAADAYQGYLHEEPNAPDRKALEAKIVTLRQQAAELAAARKEPPPPRPPNNENTPPSPSPVPPEREDDATAIVPWIIAGAGVAAIGTGLVLGAIAQSKHDDAVAEPSQQAAAGMQDDAEGYARASTITIVAGAIVAALGAGWIVLRATTPSTTTGSRSQRQSALLRWSF